MYEANYRVVLQTFHRLYNDRDFGRMGLVLADEIVAFRPGIPGFEPKHPILFQRGDFVEQLAIIREKAGPLHALDTTVSQQLVVASVEYESGLRASHTVQFLPNLKICRSFMIRREDLHRVTSSGALAWANKPPPQMLTIFKTAPIEV